MIECICSFEEEYGFLKSETMSIISELIRCKDCKHKNEYGYCTVYLNFHHLTADMDYCSDAERKENGNKLLCSKEQTDNR